MIKRIIVVLLLVTSTIYAEGKNLEYSNKWKTENNLYEFYLEKMEGEEIKNEEYKADDFIWKLEAKYLINGKIEQSWSDFLHADCPVDNYMGYLQNTFQNSDIDGNGKKEIVFLYKYFCRGDVSPPFMVLVTLTENGVYTIKGRMKTKYSAHENYYNDGEILKETFKDGVSEKLRKALENIWYKNSYDNEFD